MSNTIIQIKRSTTTATPPNGYLIAGEQAYSYSSNTLFIGTPDGTGIIAVGGKYYIDTTIAAFAHANAAFLAANTGLGLGAAFSAANAAFAAANGAFASANAGQSTANAAFARANLAHAHANASFASANAAQITANAAFNKANVANITADLAFTHANGAFAKANAALPSAGGTISGDLVVSGNITVSGLTTYANTQTLLIGDNIFVLNADLPSTVAPSENAGFQVNRGNQSNTGILWIEAEKQWVMQVNTGIYQVLVSNSALETTNAATTAAFFRANLAHAHANAAFEAANTSGIEAEYAFLRANLAHAHANASYAFSNSAHSIANLAFTHANNAYAKANTSGITADSAFITANQAFAKANSASAQAANADFLTTGTVPSARLSGSYTGITGVGTLTAGTWNGNTIGVGYGGTGQTTFTTNGVLFGNGGGSLQVTAAGTEGQVLQASAAGVPQFAHLDGGSF